MKVHAYRAWTIRACYWIGHLAVTRMQISIEWFRLFLFCTMKKTWLFYVMLIMSMCLFTACPNDDNDDRVDPNKPSDLVESSDELRAVDLGLSVKWASKNVDGWYSWGEVEPFDGDYPYGGGHAAQDLGNDISGTQYDVAHVKWGDGWRMPTYLELRELAYRCKSEETVENGVKGQKFTGANGNSIFLPFNGYCPFNGSLEWYGKSGYYWSSTPWEPTMGWAYLLVANGIANAGKGDCPRYYGLSVRPVKDYTAEEKHSLNPSFFSNEQEVDESIQHKGTIGHGIDLGLSVIWADHNVGAAAPEEIGGYYAFGELFEKSEYTLNNYKFHIPGTPFTAFSKYSDDFQFGDNKKELDILDDVARSKWGGKWRIPTDDEFFELSKCKKTLTTINGIKGTLVTAQNGKTIFFPNTGTKGGKETFLPGWGLYLTTTIKNDKIKIMETGGDSGYMWGELRDRYDGYVIRPVMDKN